jgi:hypothetical protein
MFQETISAICYEIGDWHFASSDSPLLAPPYNDVAEFVLEQWAQMPDYLRQPIRAATVVFDLGALARGRRLYHRSGVSRRRLHRLAWRSSALSPFRDLMRFYESLATLALYSRPIRRTGERTVAHLTMDANGCAKQDWHLTPAEKW